MISEDWFEPMKTIEIVIVSYWKSKYEYKENTMKIRGMNKNMIATTSWSDVRQQWREITTDTRAI